MCRKDPNSFANIKEVITKDLDLDIEVDFKTQSIRGYVTLALEPVVEKPTKVILDTDYLEIRSVYLLAEEGEKKLEFSLLARDSNLGSALEINLEDTIQNKNVFKVKVEYETTKEAGAIQWLEPSQTVGKKYPYLFSQCQIYARSMVPCQDTPAAKITYKASVTVPSELTALMSALSISDELSKDGTLKTFKFEQNNNIPSYLIAIVVGNLASREISERSAVWSEPEIVDAAAFEFSDTETFLKTAEDLTCKYEWGRYDLLILPPSFPYGGMENPNLTFVTPTLLAGDKSAVDVIAHELSHSWTGNLVTNYNWEHFWLNEGWTMFLERKIMAKIHGEPMRQFSAIIGWKTLEQSIEFFGKDNALTALCPNLENVNPDDAFSSVPYEKGFNFLYYLEQLLGGPVVFEPYMKAHILHFAHKSITTEDWKAYLYQYMKENHGDEKIQLLDQVDWNTWLYAPGMPPVSCDFDTSLSKPCDNLAKRWNESRDKTSFDEFKASDFQNLNANQQVVFLERFSEYPSLSTDLIKNMDSIYSITTNPNCEVKLRWQLLALRSEYEPIYPAVVKFITEQGRMKYVRPLYRALNQTENGSTLAKRTFLANKSIYHPIAAKLIEKDLFGRN